MVKNEGKIKHFLLALPAIAIILMIPLATSYKQIMTDYKRSPVFVNVTAYLDFFGWWKSIMLLVLSAFVFLLNVLFIKKGKKIPLIIYLNLGLYTVLLLLSFYFSEYREIGWQGASNYFEGVPILLCYLNLFYYSAKHLTVNGLKYIVCAFGISVFIMALIGIPQYFGFYVYQESPIKEFFLSNIKLSNIRFHWSNGGYISTTLFNPNMVGCYCALLLPILINSFLNEQKKWLIALFFLFCVCGFVCLNGSASRSGVLGTLAAVGIIAIFNFKRIFKRYLRISLLAVSYLISAVIFGETTMLRVKNFVLESWGIVQKPVGEEVVQKARVARALENRDGSIIFDTNDIYMRFVAHNPQAGIQIFDRQGKLLQFEQSKPNIFTTREPGYEDIFLHVQPFPNGKGSLFAFAEGKSEKFSFVLTPLGFKFFAWNTFLDSEVAPKINFMSNEQALSKRGYMWNRSLMLLSDCFFLGHGPQTFGFYFPQRDFVGKYNAGFSSVIMVDRPHNGYILIAHDSGLLSLVALLVIFSYILGRAFISLTKNFSSVSLAHIQLIGFTAGAMSYLLTLFFNDSYIGLAPLFWIILGATLMIVISAASATKRRA